MKKTLLISGLAFALLLAAATAASAQVAATPVDRPVVPGTAATNLAKAEDAAAADGDTGIAVLVRRCDSAATLAGAEADYTLLCADRNGVLHVRQDSPNRIHCYVAVSTATTIQAVGTNCVAPGAGLSIYVTDISFGSSAAGGTAADSFPTLKSGTGGTCGTGTAVLWGATTAANTTNLMNFSQPIKVAANSELCWIMTTAGSKVITITGFIAP